MQFVLLTGDECSNYHSPCINRLHIKRSYPVPSLSSQEVWSWGQNKNSATVTNARLCLQPAGMAEPLRRHRREQRDRQLYGTTPVPTRLRPRDEGEGGAGDGQQAVAAGADGAGQVRLEDQGGQEGRGGGGIPGAVSG